jgi:hypothetical protein
MMRFAIFLAFLNLAAPWPSALGATTGSPVKVAIVAPGQPELEALLIEKFGREAGLILLTRAELPALVEERQTVPGAGPLRIAGADWLLFIERGEGAAGHVSARVTDCSTGAVIHLAQPSSVARFSRDRGVAGFAIAAFLAGGARSRHAPDLAAWFAFRRGLD